VPKHIVFDCDGTLIDTSNFTYRLFDGIKELLQELGKDHCLYVWTARDRSSTLRILKELEVLQYFDSICTIDDAPSKPNITGLSGMVGPFQKSSICMIGDTTFDILGAKNFGILSIGAAWNPDAKTKLLAGVGADFIATHPSECSKIIQLNLT
jgi:phosphoglycolate phosphatase